MQSFRAYFITACLAVLLAYRAVAQLPSTFRVGPFGELATRPLLDPSAGIRSVLSVASDFEVRADVGVRRHPRADSTGTLVGTFGATLQWNAIGGYPERQVGVFGGYQYFTGAEHGGEFMLGASMATSHARGEHFQYEPTLVLRLQHHRALPLFRFKVVAIRLPPFLHGVPKPPPLDVRVDSVDAGGMPHDPKWMGGSRLDVDRLCRFSYVQMSGTPLLVYRPECVGRDHPTLNQPRSPETAQHGGLSCGVKDAEPIIRGHINWFVVSQNGRLRWGDFSGGLGDHDFDLFIVAPNLVTHGNVMANKGPSKDSLIEIEFNGVETAGQFSTEHGGVLWSPMVALRRLSYGSEEYDVEDRRADSLFRDRPGVAIGLLGLDGEHDFHTELHPVFALAADVSHLLADRSAHAWLVFIRNMGNEGECSDGQLPWGDSTRYMLEIPWNTGADSASVDTAASRFGFIARRQATLRVEIDPARAVRLVADLPRPSAADSTGIIYGTLRLRWYAHGLLLAHDTTPPVPREVGQAERHHERERGYAPATERGFPSSRRLCITLAPRDSVGRDVPASFPPQRVLTDTASPAPAVVDTSTCGTANTP